MKIKRSIFVAWKRIVINIKSLVQTESVLQRKSAHECIRPIAVLMQKFSERHLFWVDRAGIVTDSVMIRIKSGHERSMRGKRQRSGANCIFKKDTVASNRIQIWCLHFTTAVTAKMISAQSINGDQEKILFGCLDDGRK